MPKTTLIKVPEVSGHLRREGSLKKNKGMQKAIAHIQSMDNFKPEIETSLAFSAKNIRLELREKRECFGCFGTHFPWHGMGGLFYH